MDVFGKDKDCDGYQFMILLDQWLQDQMHYHSCIHMLWYSVSIRNGQHVRLKFVWERQKSIQILKFSLTVWQKK